MNCSKYWLFSSVLGFCLYINPVHGQIVPDNTTNTSITNNCQNACNITGGTVAGDNLFHSFDQFNIGTGESAYFVDPGVANIFSRVTGNTVSNIFGTLGVSAGDANLFLLNPNGIIFGEGATLDVNGSFLATTADKIQFGNSDSFSATPNARENLALLKIDPSALFFNQMGQNQPISINSGAILSVPEAQTITLLGGQATNDASGISLDSGAKILSQGNVNIAALKNDGQIKIDENLQLELPDNVIRGDIALNRGSQINVSGTSGGNIKLQGGNITLTDASNLFTTNQGRFDSGSISIWADNLTIAENSTITSNTVGKGKSSAIEIDVSESINLIGSDISKLQQFLASSLSGSVEIDLNNSSSINTVTLADGTSGDIKINSKNLSISNGAWIVASTFSQGDTGNISLDVENNLTLDGSGIFTGSNFIGTGDVGTLTINSTNLLLDNGSVISSSTIGKGNGGDINLVVSDLIAMHQSLPGGVVPTGVFTNTVFNNGMAGDLRIDTNRLVMSGGAELSSSSGAPIEQGTQDFISSGGIGGNITVNATDSILIQGISVDNRFPSGIVNSTFSNHPGGNIEINTGRLDLQDEAIITASSIGTGAAGDLTIVADESISMKGTSFEDLQNLFQSGLRGEIEVQNLTGGLLSNTQTGEAGNTKITAPSLTLEDGALISTSTFGEATGGNIDIVAKDVEVSSSLLASSTVGRGQAGNITIETDRLTTNNSGLITTSSTGLGNAGDLKVNATDFVKLVDFNNSNLVAGGLVTNSFGLSYSGNLEVNTKDLIIAGGAKISASNGLENLLTQDVFTGIDIPVEQLNLNSPRNVIVNAQSIDISGTSENQLFTSGITSATSSIFPASNIEINAARLAIADRGTVEVSSIGEGKAGNLNITADSMTIDSQGSLNATTLSGIGGNIELRSDEILSLNNGEIKTDAANRGNGGNIYINTNFAIASNNSNISAKAELGNGGNIQIKATDLFITPDSTITASSKLGGVDGEISIKTFDTSDRNSLAKLPEKTIQADRKIVQSCGGSNNSEGVFTYTGKGGLPANLLKDYHASDRNLIADFNLARESTPPPNLELSHARLISSSPTIVEAVTWKMNHRGKVELVAQKNDTLAEGLFSTPDCPF